MSSRARRIEAERVRRRDAARRVAERTEGALRDAADHLWKRHHCDLGNELLHPIPGPFEARALLTPTPETP